MRHGSLFSGLGGFDLAAQWMGWENVFHCEWNEFGQKILKYYWPNAISYNDITKSTFTIHRGTIDILTGGFPCQPFSTAGQRKGTDDARYLWPEMLRVIREVQPRYIVGENVSGLVNWSGGMVFEQVCADLEVEGYEVLPVLLPAAGVNAPHKRDRIFFIAHSSHKRGSDGLGQVQGTNGKISERNNDAEFGDSDQFNAADSDSRRLERSEKIRRNCINVEWEGKFGNASDSDGIRLRRKSDRFRDSELISKNYQRNDWEAFPTVSPVHFGDDGLSDRLDSITFSKWRKESIKGAGNAIVGQIALQIFKAIQEYESNTNL